MLSIGFKGVARAIAMSLRGASSRAIQSFRAMGEKPCYTRTRQRKRLDATERPNRRLLRALLRGLRRLLALLAALAERARAGTRRDRARLRRLDAGQDRRDAARRGAFRSARTPPHRDPQPAGRQ